MKKLNKKGFTLIELLVVIVILLVIMSIAIPSITSSVERSKEKQRNSKIELIESYAKVYFDKHRNSKKDYVTVEELIKEGLLTKEEAKDPFNEKSTLCGHVTRDKGFESDNTECISLE